MKEEIKSKSVSTTHHKKILKQDWPHVALVSGMLVSLGGSVVTGLKKARTVHGIFSLSFIGLAMLHLYLHHKPISRKTKGLLHLDK